MTRPPRKKRRAERAQAGHDQRETRIGAPELTGELAGGGGPAAVAEHHVDRVPRAHVLGHGIGQRGERPGRPDAGPRWGHASAGVRRCPRANALLLPHFRAPAKPDHRVRLAISTEPGTTMPGHGIAAESERDPASAKNGRAGPGRRPPAQRRQARPVDQTATSVTDPVPSPATPTPSARPPASGSCGARAGAPCASSSTPPWSPSTSAATTPPGSTTWSRSPRRRTAPSTSTSPTRRTSSGPWSPRPPPRPSSSTTPSARRPNRGGAPQWEDVRGWVRAYSELWIRYAPLFRAWTDLATIDPELVDVIRQTFTVMSDALAQQIGPGPVGPHHRPRGRRHGGAGHARPLPLPP